MRHPVSTPRRLEHVLRGTVVGVGAAMSAARRVVQ